MVDSNHMVKTTSTKSAFHHKILVVISISTPTPNQNQVPSIFKDSNSDLSDILIFDRDNIGKQIVPQ